MLLSSCMLNAAAIDTALDLSYIAPAHAPLALFAVSLVATATSSLSRIRDAHMLIDRLQCFARHSTPSLSLSLVSLALSSHHRCVTPFIHSFIQGATRTRGLHGLDAIGLGGVRVAAAVSHTNVLDHSYLFSSPVLMLKRMNSGVRAMAAARFKSFKGPTPIVCDDLYNVIA